MPRTLTDKLLESPPWSALSTTHSVFALGNDLARRYPPEIAPMAGVREISDSAFEALAALMAPGDIVGVFGPEPITEAPSLAVIAHKSIQQMIYEGHESSSCTGHTTGLGTADVPDMLDLAKLTQPGPVAARAIVLGTYVGIRNEGQPIAMAGERMRFDGFTEISAVCTHPAHRGRGHASSLVGALIRRIIARNDTPFLHLYSENTRAAALYRKLGFAPRRKLSVSVLQRPQ